MNKQETDKAAAEQKDQNAEIEDLPVAEADVDGIKGGRANNEDKIASVTCE